MKKYLVIYHSTQKIECIKILWWVLVLLFVHFTSRLAKYFYLHTLLCFHPFEEWFSLWWTLWVAQKIRWMSKVRTKIKPKVKIILKIILLSNKRKTTKMLYGHFPNNGMVPFSPFFGMYNQSTTLEQQNGFQL
jgi:hypothetical protein